MPVKREPYTTSALPSRIGGQELRVVARVVLEVRVLDQHDVPGRLGEAAPERGALALVGLLVEDPDLVLLVRRPESPRLGELGLEPAEVVALPSVEQSSTMTISFGIGRLDAARGSRGAWPLVVDGDDDGQPRGGVLSHDGGSYSKAERGALAPSDDRRPALAGGAPSGARRVDAAAERSIVAAWRDPGRAGAPSRQGADSRLAGQSVTVKPSPPSRARRPDLAASICVERDHIGLRIPPSRVLRGTVPLFQPRLRYRGAFGGLRLASWFALAGTSTGRRSTPSATWSAWRACRRASSWPAGSSAPWRGAVAGLVLAMPSLHAVTWASAATSSIRPRS